MCLMCVVEKSSTSKKSYRSKNDVIGAAVVALVLTLEVVRWSCFEAVDSKKEKENLYNLYK